MLFRRYGTFTGGIDLPEEKHATLDAPIRRPPAAKRLRVPLAPCGKSPAKPVMKRGRRVTAGQRIAQAVDASSVDIFAPLSGRVGTTTTVDVATAAGFIAVPAIELTDLSEDEFPLASEPGRDWQDAEPSALRQRLAEGGLTTCRSNPEPLGPWLDRALSNKCSTLIANVMENQPYLTAEHRLMVEHGGEIVVGLAILARAMEATEIVLAADWRRRAQYRHIGGAASRYNISSIGLPHKYPMGADTILVKVLTRRETPPGASTMAVGAAVVSASTCLAVCRWVACGVPATHRVLTLGGEAADECGNFLVPQGTACVEIAGGVDQLLIHGGPMVGLECTPGAVVTPATDALLAIEPAPFEPPGTCIRCGWCTDHCPARLNVAALNDAFELGMVDLARRDGARACVDCGVCSYVCPARLPLTSRVKQLKRTARYGKRTDIRP